MRLRRKEKGNQSNLSTLFISLSLSHLETPNRKESSSCLNLSIILSYSTSIIASLTIQGSVSVLILVVAVVAVVVVLILGVKIITVVTIIR